MPKGKQKMLRLKLDSTKYVHTISFWIFLVSTCLVGVHQPIQTNIIAAFGITTVYHGVSLFLAKPNGGGQGRFRDSFSVLKRTKVMWARCLFYSLTFAILMNNVNSSTPLESTLSVTGYFMLIAASEDIVSPRSASMFLFLAALHLLSSITSLRYTNVKLSSYIWLYVSMMGFLIAARIRLLLLRPSFLQDDNAAQIKETFIVYVEYIYAMVEIISKVPTAFLFVGSASAQPILIVVFASLSIVYSVVFGIILVYSKKELPAVVAETQARSLLEFDNAT